MISSTPTNQHKEIYLNAFDVAVEAKKSMENKCPGVVSCADIIVMVARDTMRLLGGPKWEVLKGRLNGFISQANRAEGKVPRSNSNAT
eukprot:Gb_26281 [translate_table: standard]